jgi:hypothetical protein
LLLEDLLVPLLILRAGAAPSVGVGRGRGRPMRSAWDKEPPAGSVGKTDESRMNSIGNGISEGEGGRGVAEVRRLERISIYREDAMYDYPVSKQPFIPTTRPLFSALALYWIDLHLQPSRPAFEGRETRVMNTGSGHSGVNPINR